MHDGLSIVKIRGIGLQCSMLISSVSITFPSQFPSPSLPFSISHTYSPFSMIHTPIFHLSQIPDHVNLPTMLFPSFISLSILPSILHYYRFPYSRPSPLPYSPHFPFPLCHSSPLTAPILDARRYFKQSEIVLYRQTPEAASMAQLQGPPPQPPREHGQPGGAQKAVTSPRSPQEARQERRAA